MTAKLTIELDNGTKKGFDEIAKDLEKMGVKSKDAEKAFEQLNKELESRKSADTAKKVKELADELDGTAAAAKKASDELGQFHDATIKNSKSLKELDDAAYNAAKAAGTLADYNRDLAQALDERRVKNYKDQINKLADEMAGLGKKTAQTGKTSTTFWTEINSKFQLGKGIFDQLRGGFEVFSAFSQKMAEEGNSSFGRLNSVGSKLSESFDNFLQSDAVADRIETLADILEDLIPVAEDVGEAGAWTWDLWDWGSKKAMQSALAFWDIVKLIPEAISRANAAVMRKVDPQGAKDAQNKPAPAGLAEAFDEEEEGAKGARARRKEERAKEREENRKEREARKKEQEELLLNPGAKMRSEQEKADRIDKMIGAAGQAQVEKEIAALLAKQAALVAEIKAKHLDPTTNRQVIENAKELTALETKRADLIKERQEKQKEREKALKESKAAAEKKNFDEEIKHIDTLLRESTQSADKIKELEQRRFALVRENKERERKLAIEAGTLEQKLFEEDMARIELRKKKEREAALAGIENERKLYLAREHRRDLERQAEQEKIDKFKEFLTGGGGDSFSFSGNSGNTQFTFAPTFTGGGGGGGECCCPCPGGGMGGGGMPVPMGGGMPSMPQMPMQPPMPFYPPMWQGPNVPMPQGWHGQTPWPGGPPNPRPNPLNVLTGGITPRNVWDQTAKNAQDEEEKKRIAEGQASGKLDQNGNPIDYKAEEKRQTAAAGRQWLKDQAKKFGIDIPGGDVQQSLGDERKPRAGWNQPTVELDWQTDKDGKRTWRFDDREDVQEERRRAQAAQAAKQKADAEARKQAEGDPYKKIQELNKQEEEQQRKKDVAEQTRKQGEADKSDSLPELKKKEEEESKKLADIQKAKNEELKKVREFEEKRRQESSDRTKTAKAKNDADFEGHRRRQDADAERERQFREFEDAADRHKIEADKAAGGDGTGLNLFSDERKRAADAEAEKRRAKERQFSPDYGPETPKQRADARKLAGARGRAQAKKSRAQTKTKTIQRGKRGQVTGVETTRAYHDVVQQQVQQLKNQGSLDQTQTQAIEQLTQGFRDSAMNTAEMQAKLDQLLEVIYEIRGFRPPKGRRQAGR